MELASVHGLLTTDQPATGFRSLLTRILCYTDPVSNVTLSIDEEVLKRARVRAIEQGTSVNAVVREFLESYAGAEDERRALQKFLAIAESSEAGSAGKGRGWTREELYEDRLLWPRS